MMDNLSGKIAIHFKFLLSLLKLRVRTLITQINSKTFQGLSKTISV